MAVYQYAEYLQQSTHQAYDSFHYSCGLRLNFLVASRRVEGFCGNSSPPGGRTSFCEALKLS